MPQWVREPPPATPVYPVPDNGPLGKVSLKVLSAKCDEELGGDDLAAVLTFICKDLSIAGFAEQVREEHQNWERGTMK
jgi:hypothetical protein